MGKSVSELTVALVGNPNVGKSVIFGHLTGRHANVANYPGTTVEISRGELWTNNCKVTLIDTPGINSLVPMTEDEQITHDLLLQQKTDAVIQVADAKNLRRALLISLQLIENGIPFLLDLNMEDEATSLGIAIDKKKLSSLLGVPVVGSVAIQKKGLWELRQNMTSLSPSTYRPVDSQKGELHRIHEERLKIVDSLLSQVLKKEPVQKKGWASEMGRISMHPFWGIFVLVGILFLFYEFVGNLGAQVGVDLLENKFFGEIFNPWAIQLFSKIFFFSPFLRDLFVGPYGIITMALTYAFAIILPIVTTFFIAFSVIEDSGYLPRLSVMLNRMFRLIGLNGKAVVPMVLGLGCDTMATMSARIMDTRKEKIILTLLLALGVPCSAQLGIILGMLGSLPFWVTPLWLGVVLTVLLVVGFLSSKVLSGGRSDFIMEIPPIRKPVLFNIFTKTLARLEWYLREVVPLFVLGTLVLFFLDKFRWLPVIQKMAEPLVVRVLNLPPQAAEAFLIGFLRRDYGATRFFDLYGQGELDVIQTAIALIVTTLFIPCLANVLMIVKERGVRIAIVMTAFVYPLAFLIGGIVNWGLRF